MNLPVARILCVEDDKDWCELLELMFEQTGENHQITTVSTVREALILIENISFDLYILDYVLPDGTGIEICREIRKTDPITPIMFYSAMARKIDIQAANEAGANEYLVKPDDIDSFVKTAKRLLNNKVQANPCGYGTANLKRKVYERMN